MVEAEKPYEERWVTAPRCSHLDGSNCVQAAHFQGLQAHGIGPASKMPVVDCISILLPRNKPINDSL